MKSGASDRSHERLRCADAVHTRIFDDEMVILDLARGEYFALGKIGAHLWAGLEAGRTVEQVARDVVAEYDVELEQALADLAALAEDFVSKGLMVQADRQGQAE